MADENTADAGQKNQSSFERSDEQIRNLSDLKEAVTKREEWKSKAMSLQDQLGEMQQQIEQLTETNQRKSGEFEKLYSTEATKHSALQEQFQILQQENSELNQMVENFKTENLMKQFTDAALSTVKHRERAEVMLLGLAAAGKVNLTPEDNIEEHATEARKLLENMDPSLFTSDERRAGSVPGNIPGARLNSKGTTQQMLGKFKLLPTKR